MDVFNLSEIAKQILEFIPVDPNFIVFKNVNKLFQSIVKNTLHMAPSPNENNKISLTHLDLSQFCFEMARIPYRIIGDCIYTNNSKLFGKQCLKFVDELGDQLDEDAKLQILKHWGYLEKPAARLGLCLLMGNRQSLKSIVVPKDYKGLHIVTELCPNIETISIIGTQSSKFLLPSQTKWSKINVVGYVRKIKKWSISSACMETYPGILGLHDVSIVSVGVESKDNEILYHKNFKKTDPFHSSYIDSLETYLAKEKEAKLDPLINFNQVCQTYSACGVHTVHIMRMTKILSNELRNNDYLDDEFWKHMIKTLDPIIMCNSLSDCLSSSHRMNLFRIMFGGTKTQPELDLILTMFAMIIDAKIIHEILAVLLEKNNPQNFAMCFLTIPGYLRPKLWATIAAHNIPIPDLATTRNNSKIFPFGVQRVVMNHLRTNRSMSLDDILTIIDCYSNNEHNSLGFWTNVIEKIGPVTSKFDSCDWDRLVKSVASTMNEVMLKKLLAHKCCVVENCEMGLDSARAETSKYDKRSKKRMLAKAGITNNPPAKK